MPPHPANPSTKGARILNWEGRAFSVGVLVATYYLYQTCEGCGPS